jgi:hypothetical protein
MDGEECAERVWEAPEVILVVDLEGRSAVDACLSVPLAGTRGKRAIVRVEPDSCESDLWRWLMTGGDRMRTVEVCREGTTGGPSIREGRVIPERR